MNEERCMDCGSDYLRWWAPTDLFLTVIGGHYGPSMLCLDCFHDRAERLGIRLTWRPMTEDEAGPFIGSDTAYAFERWRTERHALSGQDESGDPDRSVSVPLGPPEMAESEGESA